METENHSLLSITACRLCGAPLGEPVLSLGNQPISNRLATSQQEDATLRTYPLSIVLCSACGLPQLEHNLQASDHFHGDYVYLSGASSTWVQHCSEYAQDLVQHQGLCEGDFIIETGSNDGTLLKAFSALGLRTLGIEPSSNVADLARKDGIETLATFFNEAAATLIRKKHGVPKALVGNNVLAHVPDTDAFLRAARDLIDPEGFLCFEFPHFVHILDRRYFDTIYHEHYTYLGVGPLQKWADNNGMELYDVERHSTHGGSLRVFLRHQGARARFQKHSSMIDAIIADETALKGAEPWHQLARWLEQWRERLRSSLADFTAEGKKVVGYAAASKATVLCNYLGVTVDDIAYCCDASPTKQHRIIPGTGIPIVEPERIRKEPPDVVMVFAWNIFDEILSRISKLVTRPTTVIQPLPDIKIVSVHVGEQE